MVDGAAEGAAGRVADGVAEGAADGAAVRADDTTADGAAGNAVTSGMTSADVVSAHADLTGDKHDLLMQGVNGEAGWPPNGAKIRDAVSKTCCQWQKHGRTLGSIGCVHVCTS